MLSELNGVSNASDYSSCWMLYSDLTELDGVIYGNPAYFDGGKQSNVLNYETTLELKAGDTVYFILGNENGANPAAYPNGGLDIVLTQVIG